MKMRQVLSFITFCTVVVAIGLVLVLMRIDPHDAGAVAVVTLQLLIFLFVWGVTSVVGSVVRHTRDPDTLAIRHVQRSMRQGLWFAVLVVAALQLAHLELLMVWTVLPLLGALACLELYFLTKRPR